MTGVELEVVPSWLYVLGAAVSMGMTGLLGIVFLHYRSVQNGKLVPRLTVDLLESRHTDRVSDLLARIAEIIEERNAWKQVAGVEQDTNRIQAAQIDEMTEAMKVMEATMRALTGRPPNDV